MSDDDDNNNHDPETESRLDLVRPPAPGYLRGRGRRITGRDCFRRRDRYPRHRKQLAIEELIGQLIGLHGLTDRVREQCVYIFWGEIVGDRIRKRTLPDAVSEGVLKVWVQTSVWMHELQFYKTRMIAWINDWTAARRVWLGLPPLVTDIRFVLGTPRQPIVDREQLRRLQVQHEWRVRPRAVIAPPAVVSERDRQAIRAEASVVDDAELRALIEVVRSKWNR